MNVVKLNKILHIFMTKLLEMITLGSKIKKFHKGKQHLCALVPGCVTVWHVLFFHEGVMV